MLSLRHETSPAWLDAVRADVVGFLQDHAANERKVAVSALTLVAQHPQRAELAAALIPVAREEVEHFEAVHRLLVERGIGLGQDRPQPYVSALRRAARQPGVDEYLLDRLLVFGLIEARACERFGLLAEGLDDGELRGFYADLVRCEARHHGTYVRLARQYFPPERVDARLDELLELEADVSRGLEPRAALF